MLAGGLVLSVVDAINLRPMRFNVASTGATQFGASLRPEQFGPVGTTR